MWRYKFMAAADDEYWKFVRKMNQPRVEINNESCKTATIITVNCANHHEYLLDIVQFLTDLNLIITKAYLSTDGRWVLDVFYVIDCRGNKVFDKEMISYIKTTIESDAIYPVNNLSFPPSSDHTSIELLGYDRPGLFSEVCAVLTDLKCNVVKANIWTNNLRVAAVVHVTDETTGRAIEERERHSTIEELLGNVMRGNHSHLTVSSFAKTTMVTSSQTERRLHQMMLDGLDYKRVEMDLREMDLGVARNDSSCLTCVTVMAQTERGYTVVYLKSKDRPKLLFDTIFALTDMKYVVHHGNVKTEGREAYQEYHIRHSDGRPLSSDAERERVKQCLEAAIERRSSQGLVLELRTGDKFGLLSDMTRLFRENGLNIRRSEIATKDGIAVDTFYVTTVRGCIVEAKTIELIKKQVGQKAELKVEHDSPKPTPCKVMRILRILLGCFLKCAPS